MALFPKLYLEHNRSLTGVLVGRSGGEHPRSVMAVVLFVVAIAAGGVWAAPFKNLDFEQANVVKVSGGTPFDARGPIAASAALPGWTVYEDTTKCDVVWGSPGLDETSVCLIGSGANSIYPSIDGNFSIEITSYADGPAGYFKTATLLQAGDIPAEAKSIVFSLRPLKGLVKPNPVVSINGVAIAVSKNSESNGIQTWSGDVSPFASLSSSFLEFSAAGVSGSFPTNEDAYDLDNIAFVVPEPAGVSLFALAALGTLSRRFRGKATSGNVTKGSV